MKAVNYILGFATLAVLALVVAYLTYQNFTALAGTDQGSEYTATLVNASDVGTSSIKSTAGTLGSIVIASTSPTGSTVGPYIVFYDTASTTIATTSMTAKVSFGGAGATTPPAGTYEFDVAFGAGIYAWVNPSFNGSYTVTYR